MFFKKIHSRIKIILIMIYLVIILMADGMKLVVREYFTQEHLEQILIHI